MERATRKAADRGVSATFRAADVTGLDVTGPDVSGVDGAGLGAVGLGTAGAAFDTVLDSGLLHCLAPPAQLRYPEVLHRVRRGGGRIAVLCFADRPGARTPDRGRLVDEARLRERSPGAGTIDELVPADILGVIPDGLGEISTWPRDDKGRTPMTGWRLRARRTGYVEPSTGDR